MQEVPESRLIIRDVLPLPDRLERLRHKLEELGLPLARIELQGGSRSFWHIYREIDMVLDTFPYPGGFMTALALYFGVPVITLTGNRYGARLGASILKSAGRDAWIAENVAEYKSLAIEWGKNPARLQREKTSLFEEIEASALLDVRTYVKMVEQGYLELLKRAKP